MNKAESLMIQYPSLSFNFSKTLPKKFGGYIDGNNVIINDNKTYKEQTEIIAEEIAHYEISNGNILDPSIPNNRKQEAEARRLACTFLISLDGLTACYDVGMDTSQELADFFDVSIPFLHKTIDNYRDKLGLEFDHKGYHFDLRNGLNISKSPKSDDLKS